MPNTRLSHRVALLLAVIALVMAGCTALRRLRPPAETFCTSGNYSKSRPLICVDQSLHANPSPAHVYDVEADNGRRTTHPVVVHWFTQRTSDLIIEFREANCVEPIQCDHRGHCWAKVKKLDTPVGANGRPASRQCTYHMTLGDSKIDPDGELVVDPCCWWP